MFEEGSNKPGPGLLIGAFERDNFGDLLFLAVTDHLLAPLLGRPATPFGGLLPPTYSPLHAPGAPTRRDSVSPGSSIESYARLLTDSAPAFLWMVGGEAGGTTMRDAYRMAHSSQEQSAEHYYDLMATTGVDRDASPYLPPPDPFSPLIVNSAGLSSIVRLAHSQRMRVLESLRHAHYVSVRERASHLALRRLRIDHEVAPDLIHVLPRLHQPANNPRTDLALVQAKVRYVEAIGRSEFVRRLTMVPALAQYEVRLFSAGEAVGHDSTALLHDLAEMMNQTGKLRATVSSAVSALDKADEIANAGLWIGTSLHGYIISTAFGVPRVGLDLPKLQQYAESWDIAGPAGVPLSKLSEAIEIAASSLYRNRFARESERLAAAAARNFDRAKRIAMVPQEVARPSAHRPSLRIPGDPARFLGTLALKLDLLRTRDSSIWRSGN